MSERINSIGSEESSSESKSSEKDSTDSKSSGKGRGGRGLGSLAARTTGRGAETKSEAAKSEVAEKSKPILDRILGVKDSPEGVAKSEETTGGKPVIGETEDVAQSPAQRAEEQIVQTLAGEGEINLRDLSRVPESHDEVIVERAVEEAVSRQVDEVAVTEAMPVADNEMVDNADEAETEVVEQAESTSEMTSGDAEMLEPEEDEDPPVALSAATSASSRASSATPQTSSGHSGGSGGRPPVPPTPPGTPPPRPPHRRRMPAAYPQPNPNAYTAPTAANMVSSPATPNVLQTGAIEAAQEYAYRRGRNRGLVTGLIVGGGIEHIRHKRREKRMERKFAAERKEQGKKIENIHWDQVREAEAAKAREVVAAKYRPSEQAGSVLKQEIDRNPQTQSATEVVRQRAEIQTEIEKKLAIERKETVRVLSKAEQIEQERQLEQLELAQGHHIERSAWHNIEVDRHGKTVQETALEYGHEYYKERGHETGPKTKQQVAAAGEVALVAAALGGGASAGLSQGDHGAASQPQGSSLAHTQPHAPDKQSLLKAVTTPPTTLAGTVGWFVAFVVILVVLLIVAF